MSKNRSAGGRVRRSSAVLSVSALAATALISTASPASAALTAGPDNDATGHPAYFADSEGLALQLCLDACVEEAEPGEPAPEPADPNHAPYFAAEATAGVFSISYEVATDAEVEGGPGEVVNAAGIGARGVTPGATYRVQGPWGTLRVAADDRGRVQADVPNAVEGFLRSPQATGDMIGVDHELPPTRVTGSPTGFNRVTVTGPGVNATTNKFALVGQLAEDLAMTQISTRSLDMGTSSTAVTKQIRYTNFGTANATPRVSIRGTNAARFSVVQSSATVAPGGSSLISVTYTPRPNRAHSAVLRVADNSLAATRTVALTGHGPDTLSPKLVSQTPARGATDVARGKNVKVQFSEKMRGVRRSTFTLTNNRTDRRVRATVDGRRANRWVLNPRKALSPGTRYTVRLVGGQRAVRDTSNNALRNKSWRFRTR